MSASSVQSLVPGDWLSRSLTRHSEERSGSGRAETAGDVMFAGTMTRPSPWPHMSLAQLHESDEPRRNLNVNRREEDSCKDL